MKNLYLVLHPDRALGNAKTRGTEWPQKIRIVFEDDVSAHGVEIPIRNGHVPAKISIPKLKYHNKPACLSTVRASS